MCSVLFAGSWSQSVGGWSQIVTLSVNTSSKVSRPPQAQSQELDFETQNEEKTREIESDRVGEEGGERIYRFPVCDSV